MTRKYIFILYVLTLVSMGTATIIERNHGTTYAHETIYGAWWFVALWAALAALGIFYVLKRKVKPISTFLLHLSFVIILAGALLTHISAKKGMIHLRTGKPTNEYYTSDGQQGMNKEKLPFTLTLNKFETTYHKGTNAAADYKSVFTITDGKEKDVGSVSMNNIYSHRSYRFYQASYDEDGKGSTLSINADPYGIPITYAGYALLFFSLVWMLVDPKGGYRMVLRHPLLRKGALVAALLLTFGQGTMAQSVLPKETAKKFGELNILYNDRICPVQTYALDFCKKVYGARSYKGFTAEQVLTGWIFYGDEWSKEPFIHIKSGELKTTLALPDYCSVNSFFVKEMGGYTIGPYVEEYYRGAQDKFHQQAANIDGKLQLIMDLRRGSTLKVLPYTDHKTTWYAPTDKLPKTVERQHALYISNVFSLVYDDIQKGNLSRVDEFFAKMKKYQEISAGNTLPTKVQYQAERINNAVPFATILFMANLTLGFIALFYTIYRLTKKRSFKFMDYGMPALLGISFLILTFSLALRWIISGNIPMSNGYETMLSVAWFVQLISICMQFRVRIVMVFGFLLSGFFLLVSHINQMDPAIGQMMPVLNSPLLSLHVSVIMMSYALLSLTFICGIMGICLRSHGEELQALSRVFLYPALTTMGIGIFVGAIWANVSWGTYWSWDSKETWALITFMVYAIVVHTQTLPAFRKPLTYHIYMSLAFLSIIMTYFGVNYFLTGMHSYA